MTEARRAQGSRVRNDLETLLLVGQSINSTLQLEDLLGRVAEAAATVCNAEGSSILLLSDDGRLTFESVYPARPELVAALKTVTLRLGEGVAGAVAEKNEPAIVSHVKKDSRWSRKGDEASGYQTRDMLVVPLAVEGRVLGVLEVVNKKRGSYTEADLPLCSALAGMAATAIDNARLHTRLKEALLRLRDMEARRTQYISTVSHELRTPITVMKGFVQILERFGDRLEQQRREEYLRDMHRELDSLSGLIDDLFVVNEIHDLPRQCVFMPLDMRDLVLRYVDIWRGLNPTYEVQVEDTAPHEPVAYVARADRKKITHCLYHLLDNAAKFSPRDSRIDIRLEALPDGLMVSIRDQGIGIPESFHDRVFEPFWQADSSDTRQYGGLGLGLYIVREILQVHGGRVSLTSLPERGSTFTLYLPYTPPIWAEPKGEADAPAAHRGLDACRPAL